MNNDAMSAIVEHLCNEARNSMHATFGVMELLREAVDDSTLSASADIGRATAHQLLCSLDDVRELLSTTVPPPAAVDEFDLAVSAGQIIEVLNLASGNQMRRLVLDASGKPQPLIQDRIGVEQLLTRVLGCAFKIARASEVTVSVLPGKADNEVRITIESRDAELPDRLNQWLNADPNQAALNRPGDIPYGIAMLVAGKQLRWLGGSSEISNDGVLGSAVAICLPSRSESVHAAAPEGAGNALSVLVAEDCDDSFALSELMLQPEYVQRARNGHEALAMIQKHRFDVVFMDVHMPGMDGYEAIRAMRDWETQTGNARTPIVILSSDDLDTQRRYAAQCGCSGFFRKPLKMSDLTIVLDRLKQARA